MKKIKKLLCALLVMLTAVTMLSEPFQVEVQAARTVNANKNWKKAPTIKKKGTYNINDKKNEGFVRFKAPNSGTYILTVYNMRDWGKSSAASKNIGFYCVYKKAGNYYNMQKLTTNYGKSYDFKICSKYWSRNASIVKKSTSGYLYSRYAKVKLKKGETILIRSYWTGGKHQYTLKIK